MEGKEKSMRIKKRRFGRDGESPYATGATHVIKIGFDARGPKATRPFPGKLPGFLICRDSLNENGNLMVDHECMIALGSQYTPEAIAKAKAMQFKAPTGTLPTEIFFVLSNNAKAAGDSWDYPSTFAESYECWRKDGLFCSGNGERATRKNPDGTKGIIACVPAGREGSTVQEFCPQSTSNPRECKAHSRLSLCLYTLDANDTPQPLSKALGWQARFRFDTSSECSPPRVLAELDQAATRLNGHIAGITGALTYLIQKKRYGGNGGGVGITGQVVFTLSEPDISDRERDLFQQRIQMSQQALIEGPVAETPNVNPFEQENAPCKEPETVDAEIHGEPEESPFDESPLQQSPAATDLPPSALDGVSDEDLADSLEAFVGDQLAAYAMYTHKGEEHRIDDINWFFDGAQGAKDQARRQLLRRICQDLHDTPGTTFEIIVHKEATE